MVKEIVQEMGVQLEKHGYKGSMVSVEHLPALRQDIETSHQEGLFDEEFYQDHLSWFDFKLPEGLPEAQSLIVVAVPQPQFRFSFMVDEKPFSFLIPPHYFSGTDTDVRNVLTSLLEPQGYDLIRARLPLKLLAVHSGLAQYGKNNIAYIPGMGSFLRLVAFYTDLPCVEDHWGECHTLERCTTCSACVKSCPTGAIAPDRFLLRAERCITFYNEGDEAFPEWLDASWHNCLVGCLLCQKCCPVNTQFLSWIEEREEFSQEETALLLQGIPKEALPAEIVQKFSQYDIIKHVHVFPQNLRVLIDKQATAGRTPK